MDLTVVERAGLKLTDLAEIVGVSRGRVSQWKHLPPAPTSERYQVVIDTLRRLTAAVEAGKLPLPLMDKSARTRVVEKLKSKINN